MEVTSHVGITDCCKRSKTHVWTFVGKVHCARIQILCSPKWWWFLIVIYLRARDKTAVHRNKMQVGVYWLLAAGYMLLPGLVGTAFGSYLAVWRKLSTCTLDAP